MIDDSDDASSPDSGSLVRTRYSSDESPSEAIVRAIAAVDGAEPADLDPLYESIETDALDALLGEPVLREGHPLVVEFVASGYRVVVSDDGQLTVSGTADDG